MSRTVLSLLFFLSSAAFVSSPAIAGAGSLETLTLPAPAPGGGMYYSDVQASFPGVDWSTLDRLYLPAGEWEGLRLANLPDRSPDRPLVITNIGGQARFGQLGGTSHAVRLSGGSNWRFTGRYDSIAQTGDAAFPGHGKGYADSRGRYGIFIDDAFESPGLSGMAIGGRATDFEIDFVEITRVGFAGALFKTDDQGDANMSNVRFHDNYVHDTDSEGLYFGSTQSGPQHPLPQLKVYNNRIIRAGTEIVQLGHVGRGSEIFNNVFAFGALTWKKPFQNFQDNGGQFGVREGETSIHHNILIGGASSFFQFFPTVRDGDTHVNGDQVEIRDNYFSHSRNFGIYFHAQSDMITEYVIRDNFFREVNFHYTELAPDTQDRNSIIITFNFDSPINIVNNTWSGPQILVAAQGANVVETGSVQVPSIAPVEFVDSGFPADFDYSSMEAWTDVDTNGNAVTYGAGDYVVTLGELGGAKVYRSLQANTNRPPAANPAFWEELAPLVDDYRLDPESPFQGFGLLDKVGVFLNGFEGGTVSDWSSFVSGL